MRNYGVLAAAAALIMNTTGVFAQEEPVPDDTAIGYGVEEYLRWAGIYAGVEGGWLHGQDDAFEIFTSSGFVNDGPLSYDTDGFSVGGLLGINMQVGHWVYGGELDAEFTNLSGEFDWRDDLMQLNGNGLTKDLQFLSSLRARAGFALDRFFLYGTGGLALGRVDMTTFDGPPPLSTIEGKVTQFGWTAGGGLAVQIYGNWSAGVEYRFTDLGQTDVNGMIFEHDFTYTHTNRFQAVRGRLVYRMHI